MKTSFRFIGRIALFVVLFFAGALAALATPVTYEGRWEARFEDLLIPEDGLPASSSVRRFVVTDAGETLELVFADPAAAPGLLSGARVRVTGERSGATLRIASATGVVVLSAPPSPSQNARAATYNVQILLVNFRDDTRRPFTIQQAQDAVNGLTNAFFQETSYGQVGLSGTAYGWLTLQIPADSSYGAVSAEADAAAAAVGIPTSWSRRIYVTPAKTPQRRHDGAGELGGRRSWLNGNLRSRVITHELGHNFGLHHADSQDCGDPAWDPNLDCAWREYGDYFDNMGTSIWQFNAAYRERLGWLTVQEVTASRNWLIYPIELNDPTKLRALKIPVRAGNRTYTYYLEYRRPIGQFDQPNENVNNGLLVHVVDDSFRPGEPPRSLVVDMTPETDSFHDPALPVGRTFQDPVAGLTLHVIEATAERLFVSIILPDKVELPAAQTSARGGRWFSDTGADLWTAWIPAWAEYQVTLPREGMWQIGVWAENRGPYFNAYEMQLQVTVDGEDRGILRIPSETYISRYGLLRLFLPAGAHTVRLTWLNDFYDPGPPVRDANLELLSVFVRETPYAYLYPAQYPSARSGGWIFEGQDLLTFWHPEWVEYRLNIFEEDDWEIGLIAKNGRVAPPPGYSFAVEMQIDGGAPRIVQVPASLTSYRDGSLGVVRLLQGYHTVRLRWVNDSCCAAGDANLQLHGLFYRNLEKVPF